MVNVDFPLVGEHTAGYLSGFRDSIELHLFSYVYPDTDYVDQSLIRSVKHGNPLRSPQNKDLRISVLIHDTIEVMLVHNIFGQDSIETFMAFPIVVTNKSNESVIIGSQNNIDLLLEAKLNDKWYTIEPEENTSRDYEMILPPNYLAVSTGLLYASDFQTELRYRLGGCVSNTFRGRIKRNWMP